MRTLYGLLKAIANLTAETISGRRVQPQAGGPVLLGSVPVALVTAALVRLVWRWIMADQFWLHDVQ